MNPGWYPDPNEPPHAARVERYWSGVAWTEHTRPTQLGVPPKVSYQRAVAILTVLGLIVVIVYALRPL